MTDRAAAVHGRKAGASGTRIGDPREGDDHRGDVVAVVALLLVRVRVRVRVRIRVLGLD